MICSINVDSKFFGGDGLKITLHIHPYQSTAVNWTTKENYRVVPKRCIWPTGDSAYTPVPYRVVQKKQSNIILRFDAHFCHMGTALASECPDVKNYKWRLNPVWHMMLYSCTHMATVGVKGLIEHNMFYVLIASWLKMALHIRARRQCMQQSEMMAWTRVARFAYKHIQADKFLYYIHLFLQNYLIWQSQDVANLLTPNVSTWVQL